MARGAAFRTWLSVLAAIAVWIAPAAAVEDVTVVLSADLLPYQQALAAFEQALGRTVPVVKLHPDHPFPGLESRVVLGIGGKAALKKYPESSVLIYCMAPGTVLAPADRAGVSVQISMMPAPVPTLARLKELQPGLKRLALFWASPRYDAYLRDFRKAAQDAGVELLVQKLDQGDALPEALRRLQGKVDALWIPSDPLLVTEQNLVLLSKFSASNRIPFYSAVAGLAKKGATATLSVSYAEIGRLAAQTTRRVLSGSLRVSDAYSEVIDVTISIEAAAQAGLSIPKAMEGAALEVVP